MRDFFAGILLLACAFVVISSLIALIKPLPKLKLPTRASAFKGLGLGVILFVATAIVIPVPDEKPSNDQTTAMPSADQPVAISVAEDTPKVEESLVPELTNPQKNAVRNAEQYLSMSGFSRDGLIEQLSSSAGNGYDRADAIAAVDSLTVDWNEEAAQSAEQYLSMTGFSCSGLIDQLSSSAGNKYTKEQAKYGARKAGAC